MSAHAWMSDAACVGDDNGATYRAMDEFARVQFCRQQCPVMGECRQHIISISTAMKADEAEVAGGMTCKQIAAEVRRRDHGIPAHEDDLLAYIDSQIRAELVSA